MIKKDGENENEYIEEAEGMGSLELVERLESIDSEINQQLGVSSVDDSDKDIYAFNPSKQTGTVLAMIICAVISIGFIYFVIISLGVLLYSTDYVGFAVSALLISVGVILLNSALFGVLLSNIIYCRRYRKYVEALNNNDIIMVDDLANQLDMQQEKVIKDLSVAVRKKFIPQGYFSKDNILFILTDEKYEEYIDKQQTSQGGLS